MNKSERLKQLEEMLQQNSVRIIYDVLKGEGGLCKVRDKYYVIVNRNISVEQKITLLAHGLMDVTGTPVDLDLN